MLTIDGPVNGTGNSQNYGETNHKSTNKVVDEFVYVGCGLIL